jgi:hypothetical protein|tara:strand:+ start:9543 stop:9656 length:114 start_codon:yes stop_codon:yes gene_type:complete
MGFMISKKNTYKPKQENVVKLKVFIDKILNKQNNKNK